MNTAGGPGPTGAHNPSKMGSTPMPATSIDMPCAHERRAASGRGGAFRGRGRHSRFPAGEGTSIRKDYQPLSGLNGAR